jgi:hypothetical protein
MEFFRGIKLDLWALSHLKCVIFLIIILCFNLVSDLGRRGVWPVMHGSAWDVIEDCLGEFVLHWWVVVQVVCPINVSVESSAYNFLSRELGVLVRVLIEEWIILRGRYACVWSDLVCGAGIWCNHYTLRRTPLCCRAYIATRDYQTMCE